MCILADSKELEQADDSYETGNDFIEESDTDSDNDIVNDADFEGSLTKIAPEDIDEKLKSIDMDRSELIHTYKLERFKSLVDVRVDNKYTLTCQSVGGKVFKGGKWKSTKNVVVEV